MSKTGWGGPTTLQKKSFDAMGVNNVERVETHIIRKFHHVCPKHGGRRGGAKLGKRPKFNYCLLALSTCLQSTLYSLMYNSHIYSLLCIVCTLEPTV